MLIITLWGSTVILILDMRKLKHREIKEIIQGYIASK